MKTFDGWRGKLRARNFILGGSELGKVFDQLIDIVASLTKGGEFDGGRANAVEEIFAKLLLGNQLRKGLVGGGEDADVDFDVIGGSEFLENSFLQDAEEFDLHRLREVANFVKEKSASIGLLESAFAIGDRSGKGSAHVSKELAFEQVLGNGSAVDRDERFLASVAVLIEGAGDELFAGAGFAQDKDGDLGGGKAANLLVDFLHRRAAPEQLRLAGVARGSADFEWTAHGLARAEGTL